MPCFIRRDIENLNPGRLSILSSRRRNSKASSTMFSFTEPFPSDIIERILAFSMLGLTTQQRARQAQALSLVHRSWTKWAQRLALGEVEVKSRPTLMALQRRLDELDAAGVVRALTIRCPTSNAGTALTPTNEWISATDLFATLKQTPKLARLSVYQPDFSPLPADMEAFGSSSAIQHLTSFALSALAHQACETLIISVLENAPLLAMLTLSGGPVTTSYRFRPVQRFPSKLRRLVVDGAFYNSVLFDGWDPVMPVEAYAALDELAVPVEFGAARLAAEVLETSAATLRTLVIPVQGLSSLWHQLSRLTSSRHRNRHAYVGLATFHHVRRSTAYPSLPQHSQHQPVGTRTPPQAPQVQPHVARPRLELVWRAPAHPPSGPADAQSRSSRSTRSRSLRPRSGHSLSLPKRLEQDRTVPLGG